MSATSDYKKDVLIVDDDKYILMLMCTLFEKVGCLVTTTTNPKEAIEIAKGRQINGDPFSLIVVDIRMPHVNGNQVAKEIRDSGYLGPIIAFTANASLSGKREAKSVGIDGYFNKGTLKADLIQALVDQYCK